MPAFWYQQQKILAAKLLQPLGWLYGIAAHLHGAWRARSPYFAAVPVISVGNLVVGGAGKTPIVQFLAQYYAGQGHQVAIVSRGYGGTESQLPLAVSTTQHTAKQVGDEPLMLARALAGHYVQVWVGRHRPSVVRRAEQAGATLILLDDAFQRRDVARNADLLVIDGPTGFGNGLTMPAGPLREFISARNRATLAVVLNEPTDRANTYYGLPALRLTTRLEHNSIPRGPLLAFAGLAHPNKFFTALQQTGATVTQTISFPDHHAYTTADLQQLQDLSAQTKSTLVTTAKDAVKIPTGLAQIIPLYLTGNTPELTTELDLQIA